MSKRCELQKEYYQQYGNYKGEGKYRDDYVGWLEEQILALRIPGIGSKRPLDLGTLERVRDAAYLYSDLSSRSLLCRWVEDRINELSKAACASGGVGEGVSGGYKEKYEKCIEVIKRFDPGIISMYDL